VSKDPTEHTGPGRPAKFGTQISKHPLHLGLGATAHEEPLFTGGMDWYADYVERHVDDGAEGRLV